MGTFLLLLFIFFVVVPLFKVLWRVWQIRSNLKRAQRDIYDRFNNAQQQQYTDTSDTDYRSRNKKKKIDPNDGEYVTFEEIEINKTSTDNAGSSGRRNDVRIESQVEDADWEDIK